MCHNGNSTKNIIRNSKQICANPLGRLKDTCFRFRQQTKQNTVFPTRRLCWMTPLHYYNVFIILWKILNLHSRTTRLIRNFRIFMKYFYRTLKMAVYFYWLWLCKVCNYFMSFHTINFTQVFVFLVTEFCVMKIENVENVSTFSVIFM